MSGNGYCPDCGREAHRVLNIGRQHWSVCFECRNRWCLGENLFSGWKRESLGDWVANQLRIETFTVVPIERTLR